ncbi:hypothetical protein EAI_06156 [Harpegnathos saltator]|uniref:AAA-ATPase-like domain-containing protein n=2 Tax=Harpegnathos saltator TaxID=610380 RepID=E2C9N4_HARSA|nr:hypothetical protein EAI_06156 [Harpegnathos saltator]
MQVQIDQEVDQKRRRVGSSGQTNNATRTLNSIKDPQIIFNENEENFIEAVKWSGFVDKSMLIAELLKVPRLVLIFAPKRFGKSLNMNMVQRFFEIEKGRDIKHPP